MSAGSLSDGLASELLATYESDDRQVLSESPNGRHGEHNNSSSSNERTGSCATSEGSSVGIGIHISLGSSEGSCGVDDEEEAEWRTSGQSAQHGNFLLGPSLTGRGRGESVPTTEETVDDPATHKKMHEMSMVWLLTVCALVIYAFGSVFFLSTVYYDPVSNSGFKLRLVGSSTATVDDVKSDRLADQKYLIVYLATPVLITAILYEIISRRQEGSVLRARVPLLRWARSNFRSGMTHGEILFLVWIIGINLGVFVAAVTSQCSRAMQGVDRDFLASVGDNRDASSSQLSSAQLRGNAMKSIANAFGYSAIVSVGLILLIVARPTTDFVLTDVFALSHVTGRRYYRRLGLWVCVATVFHVAFYLQPYIAEGVVAKRLVFAFDGLGDSPDVLAETTRARHARDVYLGWVIFYGELAAYALTSIAFVTVFAKTMREKAFEVYQFAHIVCGIITLCCLHLHYDGTIAWLFPWLCLLVLHTINTQANHRRPAKVIDFAPLRNGVTRLVLAASLSIDRTGNLHSGLTGKFVFVCLPSVRRVQWHALYVASSATAAQESVTLYIKSRGRWSEGVHMHAAMCRQKKCFPLVFMDGFYGNQSMDRVLGARFVLLAAVGDIHAPYALSIFQELMALYAAHRHPSHLKKVMLVWTTDNLCFMKEMEPMLRMLQRLDPHGDVFIVRFYLTRQPCEEDTELFTDRTPLSLFTSKQFAASRVDERKPPHAFHRALHTSRVYFVAAKLVMASVLALCLYIARSQAHGFWVLSRVVEIMMVLLAGCVTYLLVFVELRMIAMVVGERESMLAPHDVESQEQYQLKVERMVTSGFDVIGTYEYESGLGFIEEYGVQVEAKPPTYAQLVDEMRKGARKQDPLTDLRAALGKDICVEIAAPTEKSALIVADLGDAHEAPHIQVHVEQMRV